MDVSPSKHEYLSQQNFEYHFVIFAFFILILSLLPQPSVKLVPPPLAPARVILKLVPLLFSHGVSIIPRDAFQSASDFAWSSNLLTATTALLATFWLIRNNQCNISFRVCSLKFAAFRELVTSWFLEGGHYLDEYHELFKFICYCLKSLLRSFMVEQSLNFSI